MTTSYARQPKGIPSGGQFAPDAHRESPVGLISRHQVIPDLIDLTPETRQVLDACRNAGGTPLLVGGSVRDALLARAQGVPADYKDIDIEVHGVEAEDLMNALPGDVGEVGRQFGIIYTRLNGQDFDIALPRREIKTAEGHRGFDVEVDPHLGYEAAFARRDFTINAMGWNDATGELIDLYGGQADLEAGVLRHTSEAFKEDPLRVLRAVQFAGRFDLDLDPDTAELCRSIKDSFHELPKDQLWRQFDALATKAAKPSKALETLYQTGWDEHFPALANVRGVEQDPVWHPEGPVDVHLGLAADSAATAAAGSELDREHRKIAVLAALLHDVGKAEHRQVHPNGGISNHGHAEGGVEPARGFLNSIGAPNEIKDKVLPLIREHMCHTGAGGDPTPTMVRRLIRRLAGENGRGPGIEDWARLVDADLTGRGPGNRQPIGAAWVKMAESIGWDQKPSPALLRGKHLSDAGMAVKQEYAWVIKASLEAQDEGVFDDEAGAVAWMLENKDRIVAEERPRWEANRKTREEAIEAKRAEAKEAARLAKQARRAALQPS